MADLTIREKFFDDLAKGARWDVGVSIARGNPLPLDANSVFKSYEDLETYAAGVLAYPGQVVAVVTENSTVIYYLDQEKAIQPVGVIPTGDGVSVEMDENDVIGLRDFGKAFYKYIPAEGEVAARYEKVEVSEENPWVAGLEPKVTSEGLGWYEPNPTTVDGVNSQVTALANRVTEAETDIAGIEKDYLKAADKQELADAIAAEAERADAAEKANAAAIKAIADDYLKAEDKYDDTALANRVATIEGDYLKAADIANMATDAEVEAAVKAEADRAKEVEEGLQNQINLIMNNPDTENVIDSINEFTKYVEEHGEIAEGFRTDIGANSDAIAGEINRATEAESVLSGRLDTLEAIDHDAYIAADTALKTELEAEIEKKADAETVANDIAAAIGTAAADATAKADAAKDAAIADAATKYATTGALSDLETALDERLDALEAFDHDTYATKESLTVVQTTANNASTAVTNLETRFDEIVAVGGEPNAINKIQVNGSELAIENKTVNIAVPTKFSDLTDNSGFDARITAAKTQADKGVADAAAAMAKAEENAANITAHTNRLNTVETLINGNDENDGLLKDVAALKAHDANHSAEFTTLSQTVSTNSQDIAGLKTGKADTSVTDALSGRVTANENALKALNETTIPNMNGVIASKADASALDNYYTKAQIGDIAQDKTIVQMIADAKSEATYDDTGVKQLIADEAAAARAAEAANAAEIERVNGVLVAALENDAEGLDSIKELADWINTHGNDAAEMAKGISDNADAIAAINHAETGILAQAKAHTNAAITALPAATAEALGLVKYDNATIKMNDNQQLYVAKISTDILEQGAQELVLNGGSAIA